MAIVMAAGIAPAAILRAQELSLRAGAMSARYADSVDGEAGSLGLRGAWSGARTRATAEATLYQFATGDAAGMAWGDATLIGPSSARAAGGLRLTALGTTAGGTTTASGAAELFGVRALGAWTLSLGMGGGLVRTTAAETRPTGTASLRARVDASRRLGLAGSVAGLVSGGVRFADAVASADWRHSDLSVGGLVGARTGDLAGRAWVQAWLTWAVTPVVALEGSGGTYPREINGFDFGRWFNLGVRVQLRPRSAWREAEPAWLTTLVADATPDTTVRVEPIDSLTTRVSFAIAGVGSLAIAGTWNDWRRDTLALDAAGRWSSVIQAGPGAHRFTLHDGDRTIIPAGVTKLPDDFGGEVGLLVIREKPAR